MQGSPGGDGRVARRRSGRAQRRWWTRSRRIGAELGAAVVPRFSAVSARGFGIRDSRWEIGGGLEEMAGWLIGDGRVVVQRCSGRSSAALHTRRSAAQSQLRSHHHLDRTERVKRNGRRSAPGRFGPDNGPNGRGAACDWAFRSGKRTEQLKRDGRRAALGCFGPESGPKRRRAACDWVFRSARGTERVKRDGRRAALGCFGPGRPPLSRPSRTPSLARRRAF